MDKFLVKKGNSSSNKVSKVTLKQAEVKRDRSDDESDLELDHSKIKKRSTFTLKEVKGNLFAAPQTESLAHCISEDVRMGKGIAKIFKEKFGGVKELLSQGVKPDGVAVLKRGTRYVYYMITKEKFWNKPTYNSLQKSLEAMAEHCVRHGVTALSMPRIGCGLDGLKWNRVKEIIEDTFRGKNITVSIYTL